MFTNVKQCKKQWLMLTNGLKMIGNDKKDINKYQQMLTSVNNCE